MKIKAVYLSLLCLHTFNFIAQSIAIDDPVVAVLDSLVNIKICQKPIVNNDGFKKKLFFFSEDSIPQYSDAIYESRLAKLDAESPFDLIYNSHVKNFIDLYAIKKRDLTSKALALSQLYYPLFEEILDKCKLPLELKHLAVVESALNPVARSRCGATGLWQFMYGTGKLYGLKVTSYIDERSDTYKATMAAAQYLSNLYDIFKDWQMVLAAYNAGPGTITRAIRRSGGKRTYWGIRPYLPRETQSYVPAFIAVNYIMNHTIEHNISPAFIVKSNLDVDTMIVKSPMSFEQISKVLNVPVNDIMFFNPQYKKQIIPQSGCLLMLPKNHINVFLANEPSIYEMFLKNDSINKLAKTYKEIIKIQHIVKAGETLASIANKYGVSINDIKMWNSIGNKGIFKNKKLYLYITKS